MTLRHVVFSHGQESGPWGRKITVLAQVARACGYEPHSVDYRGLEDPRERVARLLAFWQSLPQEDPRVLAGSSVGGYVSVAAAAALAARGSPPPAGLFLIAPALYLDRLPPLSADPLGCPVTVIHGWRDDIVPFMDSLRFAQREHAALHLLESDHLLHDQLPALESLLAAFLTALRQPAAPARDPTPRA